jgi:phosphoribosylformylglycinamidine cyclo-ligase
MISFSFLDVLQYNNVQVDAFFQRRSISNMTKYEVNIDDANAAKKAMVDVLETINPRVLNKVGAFSLLFNFGNLPFEHPVLVLKTEEPGSKQLMAAQHDRIEGVCIDMVNHLINDCIVMGATPLAIQDALICGKLDKGMVLRIVKALTAAASEQGCVLTGGETSEQPFVLPSGSYILTSSIVGVVDKDRIIDGSQIESGEMVLSAQASGIHTNGYTQVRKIMSENPTIMDEQIDGRAFIDEILEPHRCYYKPLKPLFEAGMISGFARITGGGICENLNRILPGHLDAEIDLSAYRINPVFGLLRQYGSISAREMLRTFNLGCGLAIVANPPQQKMSSPNSTNIRSPAIP